MAKFYRYISTFLCVILIISISGCSTFDDVINDSNQTDEVITTNDNLPVNTSAKKPNEVLTNDAVKDKKVELKGDGTDTVTVLIYMNGSNLESEAGEATTDLSEIVAAGGSKKVNVLVETLGTKKWNKKYGIASNRSQIYKVGKKGLTLVKDDLGQLDCTAEESLRDFIVWGVKNYPADRYILQFWDHGGGPVYGFGYDEWVKDENAALTIDEIQNALKSAGVYFDFIGMDCCIMSCLEVCCAFYDYCDYMILSEEFESGLGWSYTNWVKALYKNPAISTVELGKIICDDMVSANEKDKQNGDSSIMAVIDMSMLKVLFTAWKDFAYENEATLLGNNYSRKVKRKLGGRVLPALAKASKPNSWNWDFFDDDYEDYDEASFAEYYITDIMEVAGSIKSDKAAALSSAISSALVYVRSTSDDSGLTGISVSLPYGDSAFYKSMKKIFNNVGIDKNYVSWLKNFVSASGSSDTSIHDSWDDFWDGWDNYEDDYDWSDWDYADEDYDDDFWDSFNWDDWDYEDSWNEWFDDDYWDDEDGWCCDDDDWYYSDEDWYDDDDWYSDDWDYDWDDLY